MGSYRNILLVSAGAEKDGGAFSQALSQARLSGGKLTAAVLCPPLKHARAEFTGELCAFLTQSTREHLERAAAASTSGGPAPAVDIEVITSSQPALEIVRRVLREDHDLVLKSVEAPSDQRGFKALDMQLLRQCPCPVWLSRPISRSRTDIRVAVAVDPEDEGAADRDLQHRLLRTGAALAGDCDGVLRVISCWDYPIETYLREHAMMRIEPAEIDAMVEDARTSHRRKLDALLAQVSGPRVELAHLRGKPEDCIPAYVETSGVDVLVMGTVARTGIPGWVIGNTAEDVIKDLTCALVALKPSGFVSAIKAY